MKRGSRVPTRADKQPREMVTAGMFNDPEQAKEFQTLLKNNDIPAVVRRHTDDETGQARFAIVVPEECADEANVIMESQDAYDDFYEVSADDDDEEEEFNEDLFESN